MPQYLLPKFEAGECCSTNVVLKRSVLWTRGSYNWCPVSRPFVLEGPGSLYCLKSLGLAARAQRFSVGMIGRQGGDEDVYKRTSLVCLESLVIALLQAPRPPSFQR
jgi:hypothetical protein